MVLCTVCGKPFANADDSAVVEIQERPDEPWGWVAFLEDWRGSAPDGGLSRMIHPECFAELHGASALVGVIHRRERIKRDGVWKLIDERDRLRDQINKR